MTVKKTYKLSEIATKLGKKRSTLAEWSNQFREFLPTSGSGSMLKYSEDTMEVFQVIAKMREMHKSYANIKDYLKNRGQRAFIASVDAPVYTPEDTETKAVTTDDRQPTAAISHLAQDTVLNAPMPETLPSDPLLLTAPTASSNQATLMPDAKSPIRAAAHLLSSHFEGIASEMTEQRGIIQQLQQHAQTVTEQNVQLQGIAGEVSELRSQIHQVTQQMQTVTEQIKMLQNMTADSIVLRGSIQQLKQQLQPVLEQLAQAQGMAGEVSELRGGIVQLKQQLQHAGEQNARLQGMAGEVSELRGGIVQLKQQLQHSVEQLAQTQSLAGEVSELRGGIAQLKQQLQNAGEQNARLQGMAGEVSELRSSIVQVNQRVQALAEQNKQGELLATASEALTQYDRLGEQMIKQQGQINQMAKLLGWRME
ncbi:MerR family transcriptional regulator [Paenibacillus aestuarii]|nr:MerR family transcriptional regulator [Paenibacillus aestuarii]